MFNCTAYGIPITWSVFTPNMNYTNLEINNIQVHGESMDGVIMVDRIAVDESTTPITVVSSLTVNVTAELEGSKVQCSGLSAGENITEIESFIHVIGEYNKVPVKGVSSRIVVLLKVKLHFLRALSVH